MYNKHSKCAPNYEYLFLLTELTQEKICYSEIRVAGVNLKTHKNNFNRFNVISGELSERADQAAR